MFAWLMEILTHIFYFTGYIRSQSFARPLSREDEERCLAALQKGDAYARDQLIEHNLRLVAHIVKKYDIRRTQTDDLISIGTIGLIKAVDTFAPEKGKKLTTYASRCIENEILMYLRKNRNSFSDVSLNEPIANEKDGSEITLMDAIAAPEGDRAGARHFPLLCLAHRKARVSQAVSCLPPPGEERGFPINCCFLRRRML